MQDSAPYTPSPLPSVSSRQYLHQNWRLRRQGAEKWISAQVPGCVHTDLEAAGHIENPFYGTEEDRVQWIERCDWEYELTFEIEPTLLQAENLELVFEGLDTYATVWLNGNEILKADNMYRSWRVPAKGLFTSEKQHLRIFFNSPINEVLPQLARLSYRYHAVQDNAIEASPFTRKAPFHYGWDWGPRLVTSGIWQPVYIQAWSGCTLKNPYIRTLSISSHAADMQLQTDIHCNSNLPEGCIQIWDTESAQLLHEQSIDLKAGEQHVSIPFSVSSPSLWWPNGMGEQALYQFEIRLIQQETLLYKYVIRTGIRTIELRREADNRGETFEFVVNGESVFIKGANWIPADSFVTRLTDAHYESLIQSAQDAHFNMLRVWGGGIYESEAFFRHCDEKGMLVWQDFMFACSLYPGEDGFLENVK